MKYDVFICFKNSDQDHLPTRDSGHARKLYEALTADGLKVFFSEESLAEQGRGNFLTSIEAALESARVLILVASCPEHIKSRWVEAEWGSFLQDIRSGNKQEELVIFNCGKLSPKDLPLFLRCQQMFSVDCVDKLTKFVAGALPRPTPLRGFIRASLHCCHPEKNEDKIYLLTVHPGTIAGSYHVTAYWGARTAKRLTSQMKAVNLSAEMAELEVERLQREKVRDGYVERPFIRYLRTKPVRGCWPRSVCRVVPKETDHRGGSLQSRLHPRTRVSYLRNSRLERESARRNHEVLKTLADAKK